MQEQPQRPVADLHAALAQLGKGGIVHDADVRREVCQRLSAWMVAQPGWRVSGLIESPITGADGNQEYLLAVIYNL